LPTGQAIVNSALTALGLLEQGGTPSVSDSNDSLAELNAMWDAWQIDEGLIYSEISTQFILVAATPSYTIGPGAVFAMTPRPTRIFRAFSVATVGAGTNRSPIDVVPAERYYAHQDLAASASAPEEVYHDNNPDATGRSLIYLWPVPTVPTATKLELETGVPFTAWTLAGNLVVPFGYLDAINYALAFRLLPRFGVAVAAEVAQLVTALGQKAEGRIRQLNATNRMLPPPANPQPAAPAPQG